MADSDSDEEELDLDAIAVQSIRKNVTEATQERSGPKIGELEDATEETVLSDINTKAYERSGNEIQEDVIQAGSNSGSLRQDEEHISGNPIGGQKTSIQENAKSLTGGRDNQHLSNDEEEDELQLPGHSAASLGNPGHASRAAPNLVHSPTHDLYDVPSSPLSDAPSDFSIAEPVTTLAPARFIHPTIDRPIQQDNAVHELPRHASLPRIDETHTSVAGRIFRQRNPIQLHPYLLEQEQYKQSLKARGVKPVAIASTQSQHNQESQGQEDSQFQDAPDEEESQSQPIAGQSPVRLDEEVAALDQTQPQPSLNYDSDELPDISNVLNGLTVLSERRGNKRRKVLKTYSRSIGPATYPQPPVSAAERSRDIGVESVVSDDIYDVPGSPPLLETTEVVPSKRFRRKKFKVPRGFVPAQLPTPPDTSSQTPKALQNIMSLFPDLSDSDIEEEPRRPQSHVRRAPSSMALDDEPLVIPVDDSSETSASETEVLKKVSNRLKGVLPASWLRLDQHAQQPRRHRELTAESPARTQQHRGVVQRLQQSRSSSARLTTPALTTVHEISDDSDPAPSKSVATSQPSLRNAFDVLHHTSSRVNAGTQDIQEEDFVDAMLPATTRHRTKGTGRKRQTRLTDVIDRTSWSTSSRNGPANGGKQSHRTGGTRMPRRQIPRLSVLDSKSLPTRSDQPDFLKVATRQARSGQAKARHSPRNKIILMQDKRNDAEVKEVLIDWRKGRIHPRDTASISSARRVGRPPSVRERSHQQTRLPSPVTVRLSTLQELLSKPQPRVLAMSSTRKRQSRLDMDTTPHPSEDVGKRSEPTRRRPSTGERQRQGGGTAMPGQLEEVRLERTLPTYRSGFDNDLRAMRRAAHIDQTKQRAPSNIVLERYLEDTTIPMVPEQNDVEDNTVRPQALPIRRRPRKRTPQRLHVDEADIDVVTSTSMVSTPSHDTATRQTSSRTIEGLGPFGTYYTPDFDIKPLPVGTCFASSTFIGSGEFEKALAVNTRDMDSPIFQRTAITIDQKVLQLSSWTEEASTQFSELFSNCIKQYHSLKLSTGVTSSAQASMCLRKLVHHISTTLYFLDSIDRSSFLNSLATKVEHFLQELEVSTLTSASLNVATLEVDLLKYVAVLVGQGYLLCESHMVSPELKQIFAQLSQRTVSMSARRLFENGLVQLWALHQRATSSSFIEAGIGSDGHEAESIVVHHHLLSRLALPGFSFTHFINTGLAQQSLTTSTKVSIFDRTWHDLFAILPLLSLDESGVLVRSGRAIGDLGTLDAVKEILSAVFELYRTHIFELSRPINSYVRATLHRCLQLIRTWNWCRCEAALSTIFDFFARDGFALLKNEEGANTPHFLKELDKGVMPALETADRSFDIFLKALYVGLHNLRSAMPDKKIRNIAWRFIPNHGRQHGKDSSLKPADLQALRNTHDLLCVLYAASPAGFRPNLDLLRNLANFTNSHSEICKVNIRSWANLARFQLSTAEGTASLTPFIAWYNDMITKLIQQHRQARLEAQAQLEASSANGVQLAKSLVESTIASNQRQIDGILVMALVALRDVVRHANEDGLAIALFEQVALTDVLALFGSKDTRITNVLITTLEAYQAAYQRIRHPSIQPARLLTPQQSEDSQDFGDFPDMDDIDDVTITGDTQHQAIDPALTEPVQQLLSNCFGTESNVDDNLLMKVVDVWVEACNLLVFKQQRSWSYFLSPQSSGSWNQLRDTDLKRKYFPYYITTILDIAPSVIEVNSNITISAWLVSLVERESTLKYQHRLTAALLNACSNHPLLSNLPFVKDTTSGRYEISLAELGQRRVAVLSSIFSSMRTCLESSFITSTSNTQQLRHEYQDLLQQLSTLR